MRRCAPVPPIREQFSVSQPLAVLVSSSLVNSKAPVACVTTKLLGTNLYSAATSKHSWTTPCGMLKQERASRVVATFLGVAFGRMGSTEIDVITPDMAGLEFGKTVRLSSTNKGTAPRCVSSSKHRIIPQLPARTGSQPCMCGQPLGTCSPQCFLMLSSFTNLR
jgi:hypothetical protein